MQKSEHNGHIVFLCSTLKLINDECTKQGSWMGGVAIFFL